MAKRITQKELDKIIREEKVKRYPLGDGLYFTITAKGSMSFGLRYQIHGEKYYIGMGAYNRITNTLGMARVRCEVHRAQIKQGINPKLEAQKELLIERAELAKLEEQAKKGSATFERVARELINYKTDGWGTKKSRQAWENTLATYAFPIIGHMPVSEINKNHILKILQPIWIKKYETARKLRQRIEAVFSRAIYFDLRKDGNPAAYKDNLEIPLPIPKNKVVKHHPALSYKELPEFMVELGKMDGFGPLALEFLILNSNRTAEVLKAEWVEFDLDKRQWTIPAIRLGKTNRSHIVPLSEQSMAIINRLSQHAVSKYVFPNDRNLAHLSSGGMHSVIHRMCTKRKWVDDFGDKITVHGMRSTFRDYIAEQTDFDEATAETVLAHTYGSATEKAYRRGDLIEKRRRLMQHWSDYAYGKPSEKVVQLRA